ncbi:serine hydrolase domain-containing protein [Algoriphagus sediminis]|uniref:Serine hydrolase domain-containing protein n=1 Tax=Algoriphagus sediminis TaxID=3057113 RepID=A0ABT7Y8Z0_9BACT|nr:serine hydrolase domain-containing protein [Algoriphagus sediminis]MDN3202967.1 serine hydrolase domain-containing protein [Algoriphagus sediminis]
MERLIRNWLTAFSLLISALAMGQSQSEDWAEVKTQMRLMTSKGVPGMVIGIRKNGESQFFAEGYSDIPNQHPMTTDHVQYVQSISKTFVGVAILKLAEEGRIDLDVSIEKYLPARITDWIEDSEKMTVKMMLNHTSGIPEYNYLPEYITLLLQVKDYAFHPEDYIQMLEDKSPDFEPGSRYSYRNSGYVVLALLLDEITGDHARYIREQIFSPLGMETSYYRESIEYLDEPNLPKSYWDRYGNGILEDATELQKNNVKKMIGDDGIVLSPENGLRFLEGLIELKLLSSESLEKMKDWAEYEDGYPAYGLGLDYTEFAGQEAWGHSGGGIGSGANLYYFPNFNAYVFIAMNLGTVTGGVIHQNLEPELEKLYTLIFKVLK